MKTETHYFDAPAGFTFKLQLGMSTYSVAMLDSAGKRRAWSGRLWGCSLTDALAMAAYTGDPERAASGIAFLFSRIDYYHDCPGILDLWNASRYRGETEKARIARYQPYRGALKRAHDLRFSGQWSAAMAEAESIKRAIDLQPAAN